MTRIPANPVKALKLCDFEELYWDNFSNIRKQLKQGARRALYEAPVNAGILVFS